MGMNLDANVFGKALDTVNTVGKIAANLTDKKNQPMNPPPQKKDTTNTNQPHTQTVEVKVGDTDSKQKPYVLQEKKETHVHKSYPDGRALSKDECEVEKMRIQVAHENAKEEREYNLLMEENRRKERKEREDYERRVAERRREDQKKSDRRFRILGYTLIGIGLVGAGYCIYSDIRAARAAGLPAPQSKMTVTIEPKRHDRHIDEPRHNRRIDNQKTNKPIKAEGTVK